MDSFPLDYNFTTPEAWLAVGFAFVVGAAFGSFFNVVAYRLPRKMSLTRPGSHCPKCGHPIRWHDNLPIAGWLLLGGRCRDCRAPISPRYPLVELFVAAATALVCDSAFVPASGVEAEAGWYTLEVALVGSRLLLVYTLVCAALVELDGHRAPVRLLVSVLVAGILLAALDSRPQWYQCARALAAALLLGLLAWPMLVEKSDWAGIRDAAARVVELALVAVYLGLAPAAAIAVFSAALALVARQTWAAALVIGTLIWVALGRSIAEGWLPDAPDRQGLTFAAAAAAVAALSIVERIARRARVEKPKAPGDRHGCD